MGNRVATIDPEPKFREGSGWVQVGHLNNKKVAVKFLYAAADESEFENEYEQMK